MPAARRMALHSCQTHRTMPKGACQLPGRYTPMEPGTPCAWVHCNNSTEIPI